MTLPFPVLPEPVRPPDSLGTFWEKLLGMGDWKPAWGLAPASVCPQKGPWPGATPLHVLLMAFDLSDWEDTGPLWLVAAIPELVRGGMSLVAPAHSRHGGGTSVADTALMAPVWFFDLLLDAGLDVEHCSGDGRTFFDDLCLRAFHPDSARKLEVLRGRGFDFSKMQNGRMRIDRALGLVERGFVPRDSPFAEILFGIKAQLDRDFLEGSLLAPNGDFQESQPPSRGIRL